MASRNRSPEASATPLERARALALRVLSFHARSEAQLRARLARAGYEAEAEAVVAWARRLGYLDDAAYARGRAVALARRNGPRAIERRLRDEGIDGGTARAAAAAAAEERTRDRAPGESAELALCRAAARTRLRDADPGDLDARARARLARFLLGRGFSASVVARVVGGWVADT